MWGNKQESSQMLNRTGICLAGLVIASFIILILSQPYLSNTALLIIPLSAAMVCLFLLAGGNVEWIILVLAFNVNIGSVKLFGGSFVNFNRLIGITIALLLFYEVIILKRRKIFFSAQGAWVLLFGFVVLLSVLFSGNVAATLPNLRVCLRVLALYFIITNVITSRLWLSRFLRVLVFSGIMLTLFSVFDYWSIKMYGVPITDKLGVTHSSQEQLTMILSGRDARRLYGALGFTADVNFFGLILVTLFPISVWFIEEKKKAWDLFSYIGVISILGGIFLSLSRGALVALAIAGVIILKKSLLGKKTLITIIVTIMICLPMASKESLERIYSIVLYQLNIEKTSNIDIENVTSRIDSIEAGIQIFLDHPVIGIGIGNFPQVYPKYAPPRASFRQEHDAHNTYINILTETGAVGFVVFATGIFMSFAGLRRVRESAARQDDEFVYKISNVIEVSLISFLISGFFVSAPFVDILWILIACTACLQFIVDQPSHSEEVSLINNRPLDKGYAS